VKIPYSWLQEYVDCPLPATELATKLTMAGLEVDRVEERWDKIITAKITWKEPVAGSDHLNATRVTTGDGPELSIVCGAPNISVGDIVPLALPGAEFLGAAGETLTISVTNKRGVVSEGMLCSPREMGLSNEHEGIFLLPSETPLGQPLSETIIDLDIKAHRGDLFSVTGVAREVAAICNSHLRLPAIKVKESGKEKIQSLLSVTVADATLCPRFTARIIKKVRIGPSPLWLVRRLVAAGMRSINNVVDITNYVMLELGQPLHAFDYDKVADHQLVIRYAEPGEKLKTLDDQLRTLTPDMGMVCDSNGPLSIAGVMGGAMSEVTASTTTILLESANWNPGSIRRTSTRLGLRSEASGRFEKGLDPELAQMGLNRAAQLLSQLAGGVAVPGIIDVYAAPAQPRTLSFTAQDCEWLLGYPVTQTEAHAALVALEFGVVDNVEGEGMTVTIPSWRGDVKESADLVEEVARVLGYDRITSSIPTGKLPPPQPDNWFDRQERVRDILVAAGCREVVTYPLTSTAAMLNTLSDTSDVRALLTGAVITNEDEQDQTVPADQLTAVTLVNALSSQFEVLRLTLLGSLLEAASENVRQGARSLRIFEVGRRYIPMTDSLNQLPDERRTLGVLLTGPVFSDWQGNTHETDFFDAKAVIEAVCVNLHIGQIRYTPTQHPTFHPGRCALVELPTTFGATTPIRPVGIVGEIHPEIARRYGLPTRTYAMELDLQHFFAVATTIVHFRPISRYPALTRDLAIVVDRSVAAGDIAATIQSSNGDLVQAVTLFDVYEGDSIPSDKRSLAFTVVYQAVDRTLSDADGDAERKKVVALLKERYGASLRE